MKLPTKIYISIILFALVVGVWVGILRDKDKSYAALNNINATVFSKPRELINFTYTDNKNAAFSNDNLKGKWSFMFFGFTQCHSICPTTMAQMKTVFEQLSTNKYPKQMILVTVDPTNDTPEQLNSYLQTFHPDFIGVTGDEKQLEGLRKQLGILAMRNDSPHHTSTQDAIDHSGTIVLINPEGQYHAVFTMPHTASSILADFIKIQNAF